MERYINQLLHDIEMAILNRWRTCVPHYYEAGIPSPYLDPPKGWKGVEHEMLEWSEDEEIDAAMEEMERWMEDSAEQSMFYHFDLNEHQFPPVERLTDEQLEELVFNLHRLWNAFNFTAVVPDNAPARMVYSILLKRMLKPAMVLQHGHIGVEFCHYEPTDCIFKAYCSCKNMLED